MSVLTYAYRMHPVNGLVQHRATDLKDLPRMIAEGWYDSPEKVPGSAEAQAHAERLAAETAATTGREPASSGPVHGEQRKRR